MFWVFPVTVIETLLVVLPPWLLVAVTTTTAAPLGALLGTRTLQVAAPRVQVVGTPSRVATMLERVPLPGNTLLKVNTALLLTFTLPLGPATSNVGLLTTTAATLKATVLVLEPPALLVVVTTSEAAPSGVPAGTTTVQFPFPVRLVQVTAAPPFKLVLMLEMVPLPATASAMVKVVDWPTVTVPGLTVAVKLGLLIGAALTVTEVLPVAVAAEGALFTTVTVMFLVPVPRLEGTGTLQV